MDRLLGTGGLALALVVSLAGCSALMESAARTGLNINSVKTRDEFVTLMKSPGTFRNAEQIVANRSLGAVVSDVTEFANRCLKPPYHPKTEAAGGGMTALSVQEETQDPKSPAGGIFVLVAEMRASGANKTDVGLYYLSGRQKIASPLKGWIAGDKGACP